MELLFLSLLRFGRIFFVLYLWPRAINCVNNCVGSLTKKLLTIQHAQRAQRTCRARTARAKTATTPQDTNQERRSPTPDRRPVVHLCRGAASINLLRAAAAAGVLAGWRVWWCFFVSGFAPTCVILYGEKHLSGSVFLVRRVFSSFGRFLVFLMSPRGTIETLLL